MQWLGVPRATHLSLSLLTVTARSEVVLGGTFDGALAVGDRVVASATTRSGFVLALDLDGRVRWSWTFAGTASDLVSDAAGQVHVVGRADRTPLTEGDAVDDGTAMLVRLDGGVVREVHRFLGAAGGAAYEIAVDDDGARFIAMAAPRTFTLAGRTYPASDDAGAPEIVAHVDATGAVVGAFPTRGHVAALAADATGLTVAAHGSGTPIRYAPDGEEVFANLWISHDRDERLLPIRASSLVLEPDGGAIVAGTYVGAILVGDTLLRNTERHSDGYDDPCEFDAIAVGLDRRTAPSWAQPFGGHGDDAFHSVAREPSGAFWVAGEEAFACDGFSGPLPGRPLLLRYEADRAAVERVELGVERGAARVVAVAPDRSAFVLGQAGGPFLIRVLPEE